MPLISPYIKEEWKEKIRNYKYRGTDSSIFYQYFTSPACNKIVEYLPRTLAANTLTLLGLLCNVLIFGITYYYSGFSGNIHIPSWACHTCSILYFTYMMFDNLDGKQARRTGTSSAMGMLFDHGCDAVTTFLFGLGLGTVVGLDDIKWFTLMWLMIAIPFFLNTWEEYYTGELNFPMIHGVSEGTLMACTAMHLSGFFGHEFWLNTLTIGPITLQVNQLVSFCCFLAGVGFGLYSLINVITTYEEKRHDALSNLLIFIFLLVTLFTVITLSGNDSEIIKKYPKVLLLLYGFAFAKLIGHLQLAHICDTEFMQYRKSLLVSFVCLASVSILNYLGLNLINIDYLIVGFLIMHIVVWMHFAYYLTEELCDTLGIYRFSVVKRPVAVKKE